MSKVMDFLEKKYAEEKWFIFLKQLLFRYDDDGVSEMGAQLTYYLILSIFPFLIFFLSLLKFTPLADAGVLERLLAVLPGDTQEILFDIISGIMENGNIALLSFGAVGALWSSSKGILSIIKSVNRAYDLEEDRPFFKLRALSVIFTLALYLVLIVAFSILIFGEVLFNLVFISYTWPSLVIWKILKILIPLLFMGLMLSLLYKFAPSVKDGVKVKFLESLPGGVFSSLGIIIFSAIFSIYVNNFGNYSKSYGSIGGLIVLLIWLYAISIVIVLGAEVNATLISIKNESIHENQSIE